MNDPAVRNSAFNSAPIRWEDHSDWFARKLREPESNLLVLEASGLPVGQIRFESNGSRARISYSLDALVRGRGWGRRLVGLGVSYMRRLGVLRFAADVKPANAPSCAVFSRLSFEEIGVAPERQMRSFHLDLEGTRLPDEAFR